MQDQNSAEHMKSRNLMNPERAGLTELNGLADRLEPPLSQARLPCETYNDRAAQPIGITTTTLDPEVEQGHTDSPPTPGASDSSATSVWPSPVDGAALLDDICRLLKTHMAMPDAAVSATALWVVHTYTFDCGQISPILSITSPDKRCGKSTLLELLSELCHEPLMTTSATSAAIFRVIEKERPTLLIDEADLTVVGHSDIRVVLNSGHRKSSAAALRCDGEALDPRRFSTWCPKALAAIGLLEPTIQDRSISIRLQRRLKTDKVTRMRDIDQEMVEDIRQKLIRFGKDNDARLRSLSPRLPTELNDRAQDNWEPLLAIADCSGGHWPVTARNAALSLSTLFDDDDSMGRKLLIDIRVIVSSYLEMDPGCNAISTEHILTGLIDLEESPWSSWKGRALNASQLSSLLSPFEIRSKQCRINGVNKRGFEINQLELLFDRYLDDAPNPIGSGKLEETMVAAPSQS